MRSISGPSSGPIKKVIGKLRGGLAILAALSMLLAAYNISSLPNTARRSTTPYTLASAIVHDTNISAAGDPSAAVTDQIKTIIQRGNEEETEAFAYSDPYVMADTSTPAYYRQMVQNYFAMFNSGVEAVQLQDLTWGDITLQDDATATANTTETWLTTYYDGSVQQETDANVYTLVQQDGVWLVQADEHPGTGTSTGTPPSQPQPQPGSPGTAAPTPIAPAAPSTSQSTNWAGYSATGGTFSTVSGSWTIPTISAGFSNNVSADATWVGIGGVNTTDLIQAGTQAILEGGQVVYSAWWETLPDASQTVSLNVSPGDNITVSINQQTDGTWLINILDATTGQSFQKDVAYRSSLSSAEWIEEAPSVGRGMIIPLDDFGTVTFTNATTVENSQQLDVQQAGGQPIAMYSSSGQGRFGRSFGQSGQPLAQPSALGADGASFSVTRTNTSASNIIP